MVTAVSLSRIAVTKEIFLVEGAVEGGFVGCGRIKNLRIFVREREQCV